MSNECLITLEGLATIRKNLTGELTVPLHKQRMNPYVLPTALALLHELDLAEKREVSLAFDLAETQRSLAMALEDLDEAEIEIEGADATLLQMVGLFEMMFKSFDEASHELEKELEAAQTRISELEERNQNLYRLNRELEDSLVRRDLELQTPPAVAAQAKSIFEERAGDPDFPAPWRLEGKDWPYVGDVWIYAASGLAVGKIHYEGTAENIRRAVERFNRTGIWSL